MSNLGDKLREGYISVTGGQVWYQIVNPSNALPLLTLHGGPGYPHDYLEPLEDLADERPVVFYDQLGCGKSDRPDNINLWHTERFVEELGQVREALGLKQVHILGHSWGSMLAIDYALTKPAGLISLILASPALSVPRWIKDMIDYRKKLPKDVQNVLDQHEAANTIDSEEYEAATMEFYRRYLCRMNPWPKSMKLATEGEGLSVYNTMWGPNEFHVTGNLSGYDRTSYLSQIDIPTLFTCGRYDEATPETTAWYHSLLSGSEIALFEHSSHMPQIEEKEQYLMVVRSFLNRVEQHFTSY